MKGFLPVVGSALQALPSCLLTAEGFLRDPLLQSTQAESLSTHEADPGAGLVSSCQTCFRRDSTKYSLKDGAGKKQEGESDKCRPCVGPSGMCDFLRGTA